MFKFFISIFLSVFLWSCANSQNEKRLIGSCEGCEAVFEFGNKALLPTDTLPGFDSDGIKIKVTGTIYQKDGKTPAEGVILYLYHTNQKGIYPTKGDETGWARRHGYIRGWVKTDENGQYTFYTLKPAPYPGRTDPAHIHIIVLEPDGKYYWLGSYHFKGDPLLTKNETNPKTPRGGTSGLLDLEMKDGILTGSRDIILGKNVLGY
jgi:protocatechuate 3,4-dioxygenase beta subunit